MLKFGKITEIDTEKALCRVEFEDHDGMSSYWIPVLKSKTLKDKSYWMPDEGEHVACLMDKNNEEGIILGAIYSETDTPPVNSQDKCHVKFEDGTTIEYDRKENQLNIDIKGKALIKTSDTHRTEAEKDSTVKSSTKVKITAPLVEIAAGGISFTSDVEGKGADGIYTGKLHIVGQLDVTGPVNIIGNATQTGSFNLTGDITHSGNQNTSGNINATGTIIDTGGNTSNHTHVGL